MSGIRCQASGSIAVLMISRQAKFTVLFILSRHVCSLDRDSRCHIALLIWQVEAHRGPAAGSDDDDDEEGGHKSYCGRPGCRDYPHEHVAWGQRAQ